MSHRLKRLVESTDLSRAKQRLLIVRSVEVLERIGSPEAMKLLRDLSSKSGQSLATTEAKRSLARLEGRSSISAPHNKSESPQRPLGPTDSSTPQGSEPPAAPVRGNAAEQPSGIGPLARVAVYGSLASLAVIAIGIAALRTAERNRRKGKKESAGG